MFFKQIVYTGEGTEAVFKEKRGVWTLYPVAGGKDNLTLSYSGLRSPLSKANFCTNGKGCCGEGLSNWLATFVYESYVISIPSFYVNRKGEFQEGREWELTLCLRIDILWSMDTGQPLGDFNPTS